LETGTDGFMLLNGEGGDEDFFAPKKLGV